MEEGIHGFLVGAEIAAIAELKTGKKDVPHVRTEIFAAQSNDFCFMGNKERNYPFSFPVHKGDTEESKDGADGHGVVHAPSAPFVVSRPCILCCCGRYGG